MSMAQAPPGSAIISGHALLFHIEQPYSKNNRLIRAIAEFPIGYEDGILQAVTSLIHYYHDSDEPVPAEGVCYYICGKLAAIHPKTDLPDDIERSMVDFQIDAFVVSKSVLYLNLSPFFF
ncbi:hypothetical protein M422DRAFT_266630 [Sphaerobolus stellatus SS14]|uniref:Uncharacterized protein n=1 Tax=Sphaerobolus stellatus (strain SS14) TaxID=990650 RepID=A0A0C9TNW8_SPHS4|nr:hypothetical protein M422DRAFT_266630 [Sphaerobolus stellatus SS14]